MHGLQPETKQMLGLMLRELEQTIAPDLNSVHAKTVAHLMGRGLRNLLTREQGLPDLLAEWTRTEQGLLAGAGKTLPALPADPVLANQALGVAMEGLIAERLGRAKAVIDDDICCQAIEAEQDFLDGHAAIIETVNIPQRTSERRLLRDVTPDRLTQYFTKKLSQFKSLRVTGVKPVLSGFSKETLLVDMEADGKPYPVVIRRDVPYGAVDSTVVDEFDLIKALHAHGLSVPEPVLLEPDAALFGEPFIVTRRAPGAAATNTMAGVVGGPEMRHGALALAAFLARLHQVDLGKLNLPKKFYDPSSSMHDYIHREIDICERYYRNHHQQPSPTVIAALAWLRGNVPEVEGAPRLIHGDAGMANIMMDGDQFSVMLDWELAHPGDPVEDVAYPRKWINQIMPWQAFLDHYYEHGGPQYHPEREKFYEVLADLRVAAFAMRTQDMMRKTDHPELPHMYAAQHYYGYMISNVAKFLLA